MVQDPQDLSYMSLRPHLKNWRGYISLAEFGGCH